MMIIRTIALVVLSLCAVACGPELETDSVTPALKGDAAVAYTKEDYLRLVKTCEEKTKSTCVDADVALDKDGLARRVCSPCLGGSAVCCRTEIINGIRVESCTYADCSCGLILGVEWCSYQDEVV